MCNANDIDRTADDALISEPFSSQTKDIEISSQAKDIERKRKHKQVMEAIKKRTLFIRSHQGILTPLPVDWEFPFMTWSQLIQNWFLGKVHNNLPPI